MSMEIDDDLVMADASILKQHKQTNYKNDKKMKMLLKNMEPWKEEWKTTGAV
jgi:hypothetical protein